MTIFVHFEWEMLIESSHKQFDCVKEMSYGEDNQKALEMLK